ncbi:hypothetical protein BASA50_011127 [Batrachochytrium salamandrivorans]|uniref:Uncharacterized protein n=1 Tax=Batrachochytrium salamandrivorans TaxID=1357716 RepID=A0ABQ8EX10_9FUNG|nr:hypothetical protein BASA50_011127 [Batrachochytrium salamandrivorans]
MTKILEQEEELASLAENNQSCESKLVIEEHLPQFDVQEKENPIAQLVGEFIDVCSEDEVEKISTEVDESKPIQQPTVISITQEQEMDLQTKQDVHSKGQMTASSGLDRPREIIQEQVDEACQEFNDLSAANKDISGRLV